MTGTSRNCRIPMITFHDQPRPIVMTLVRVGNYVSVLGEVAGGSDENTGVSFLATSNKKHCGVHIEGGSRSGDDFSEFRAAFKSAEAKLDELSKLLHAYSGGVFFTSASRCFEQDMAEKARDEADIKDLLLTLGIRPASVSHSDLRYAIGYIAWGLRPHFTAHKRTLRQVLGAFTDEWKYEVMVHALEELGITGDDEELTRRFMELACDPHDTYVDYDEDPDLEPVD